MRDLLVPKYGEVADKAILVELLAEGSVSHTSPTTKANLDNWITTFSIPFTTLRDPEGVGLRIVKDFAPRENTFVIELATMKVLYRGFGYDKVQGAITFIKSL